MGIPGKLETEREQNHMDRYSGPLDVGIPTDTETRLNIIYFFKASKTHNFSFSMPFVVATALVVAAVMFWAITSMAWISIQRQESERLRTELKTTKSKLFEYQSRYDDVFGKVYGPESEVDPTQEQPTDAKPLENQEEQTGENKPSKALQEVVLNSVSPTLLGSNTATVGSTPVTSANADTRKEENLAAKPAELEQPKAELRTADSYVPDPSKPIDLALNAAGQGEQEERVRLRYMQKTPSDLVIDLKNISLKKTAAGYQLQFNMVNPTGVLQGGSVKLGAYFDEKPSSPWNIRESRYVGIYKGVLGGKGLSYSLKSLNSKAVYIKAPNRNAKLLKAVVQVISRPCSNNWSETCDDQKHMKTFELSVTGSQKLAIGKRTQFERVAKF